MDKKQLTETDIRTKFITPALVGTGSAKWNVMTQVREEVFFTKGRAGVPMDAAVLKIWYWRFGQQRRILRDRYGETMRSFEALTVQPQVVGSGHLSADTERPGPGHCCSSRPQPERQDRSRTQICEI
jgi:hypothetical protein